MAFVAAAMMLFLGLLFLLSGLVINFLQAVSFVALRLFWKRCYRRVNRVLVELVWIQLVWLVDWWARVEIKLYVDDEAFEYMGKEHALVIANHRSDIDWLVGWVLAQRCGCLGSSLAIMKKSIKFLPVIGWSMWFSEYLFLERNWTKDKNTLKSGLEGLRDFPCPFWLALFVEGTRFTEGKLLAAQDYAISQGLPVPRNVLIPRTKGFVSSVSNMRELVPVVYDCTVVIPEDSPRPTLLRLFSGKSSVVHVHMRRYAMEELPDTDEGLAQWCKDVFVAKDAFLDQHSSEGGFDEQEYKPIGRPVKSLLVVIFWSILLVFSAYEFFKWSLLLSTWQGIAFLIGGLVLVTGIMYVLIVFSQSERSTLAKVSAPEQTASTNSGKALQKRLLPIALNFVKLD